jgi:hypothetical protein
LEVKVKRKGAAASAFESFGSFVVKNIRQLGCPLSVLKEVYHKGRGGHKGQFDRPVDLFQ